MQIKISTAFGKQTSSDVIINMVHACDVKPSEEVIALEKGFSLDDKETWFMSRNTRINLLNCQYTPMPLSYYTISNNMPKEFSDIYKTYIETKGYADLYMINDNKRFKYISYSHAGSVVAISVLMQYVDAIESYLFVWDYATPSLYLGLNSLLNEIAWAKDNNYHYLYMGPGYEKNSMYKSTLTGFEWFTGSEWSRDIELYNKLCKRDSALSSLHDLSGIT